MHSRPVRLLGQGKGKKAIFQGDVLQSGQIEPVGRPREVLCLHDAPGNHSWPIPMDPGNRQGPMGWLSSPIWLEVLHYSSTGRIQSQSHRVKPLFQDLHSRLECNRSGLFHPNRRLLAAR